MASLEKLGEKYESDKITYHGYHRFYPFFIDSLKEKKNVEILEMGVGEGRSIKMWLDYFPKAQKIYGLDVVDLFHEKKDPRFKFVLGSQTDLKLLSGLNNGLSLIIDDGSHDPADQIISFEYLFLQKLAPGGIYIIEDIETSYWVKRVLFDKELKYGCGHPKSKIEYVKKLIDYEINRDFLDPQTKLATRRFPIASITFVQNAIIIIKEISIDVAKYHDR